jgi:hypothetical protein
LLKCLQDPLLDNIDFEKSRTATQYTILLLAILKHPKVSDLLFCFLFGFPSEDLSSCASLSATLAIKEPFEYAPKNPSEPKRGPFVPILNLQNESGSFEFPQQKPQNYIVESESNSEEDEVDIKFDENYEDPFLDDESAGRNSHNPMKSHYYQEIEEDSDRDCKGGSRSEGVVNDFSNLESDEEDFEVPMEENPQENDYLFEPQVYNNNREMEILNRLNAEGFFDKEEMDELDICKIRHDLHHPITLSRRIIFKIGNEMENVAAVTLKLIDLF